MVRVRLVLIPCVAEAVPQPNHNLRTNLSLKRLDRKTAFDKLEMLYVVLV